MIPLNSAIASANSGALTWTRISSNRRHELRMNGEVVGELTRPSFWSQKFVAETKAGRWTFRRGGFLCTGAEALDEASGQVVASFKGNWGSGGVLTFADGQAFRFTCKGWWRPVWTIATEGGQPVLLLHTREKTVELAAGASLPDGRLSLLIMFAWYRKLQADEDAASAAVTAAVVAS
jgi:hypothetical protein